MADDFLGEWEAWRHAREEGLTAPHGFLAITGLHWLGPDPQRYDGAPGAWWVGPDGVELELDSGEVLTIGDQEIRGHHLLGPVDEAGTRVGAGDLVVEVARRAGAVLMRPRDPANPRRLGHRPTPTYPPSRDWVLTATFHPRADDGASDDYVIGEVACTLAGRPVRLAAFDDGGGLWIVFSDATSGHMTYPAGRQLYAAAPAADGTVVLDFNRTLNLPCAYTDFTTCPVPPPQNRLSVAIEAGEQDPSVASQRGG